MNLVFAALLILISLIFVKKALEKKSKKRVQDERTQLIGLHASHAVFTITTTMLAISSFMLIFFGKYGTAPSSYIYYLGVITSYLACLNLILYIILYAYYKQRS